METGTRPAGTGGSVNGGLGEAYATYWDGWLHHCARQALALYPDLQPDHSRREFDPLALFYRLYARHGTGLIFSIARRNARLPGFDIAHFLLQEASNAADLARRWHAMLKQQAKVRARDGEAAGSFIETGDMLEFALSPFLVQPANRAPFGPAMMGGLAVGAFEQMADRPVEVFEQRNNGLTRPLNLSAPGQFTEIAFDSRIVIRVPIDARPRPINLASARMARLSLTHLTSAQHAPLVSRLASVMRGGEGRHIDLDEAAFRLGMSARNLSRRLTSAGLGYARLSRFMRLRTACLHLATGELGLDDIAFHADYADRHHMARDFRRMAEISPSALRDIMRG